MERKNRKVSGPSGAPPVRHHRALKQAELIAHRPVDEELAHRVLEAEPERQRLALGRRISAASATRRK